MEPKQTPAVPKGADLVTQRNITYFFLVGYFSLIGAFLSMFLYAIDLSPAVHDNLQWLQGVVTLLIGIMTAELPKQLQFWFGSSKGSKDKDSALLRG